MSQVTIHAYPESMHENGDVARWAFDVIGCRCGGAGKGNKKGRPITHYAREEAERCAQAAIERASAMVAEKELS